MQSDEKDNHREFEIDFDDEVIEENSLQEKVKKLRSQLKTSQEEAKTNLDGWQRARADYTNLQKNTEQEKSAIRKRAIEALVYDLLPALDTFDMAMKNKQVWESVDEQWRKGIEYIQQQIHGTLKQHGIEEIISTEHFDPQMHEPIEILETEDEQLKGTIIELLQRGYMMDGRIIRPAKVKMYQ